MLHLAAYIMMPFMADLALGAPLSASESKASTFVPQNSTNLPAALAINPNRSENSTLISQLILAATAADRMNLLPNAQDHVYDFNAPPHTDATTTGHGGHTVKADRDTFPALIGNGVSMTVGFIGPCGFNTPHTHPRSAEINIVVDGSLGTEFVVENGTPLIRNRLDKLQMTVFPQGAIHTEWNPDCTPATFVAGFASEDPGVQQSAQRLLDLDDDLLKAEFGGDITVNGQYIDAFRSQIPANVANGVDACLAKCGIKKRSLV